MSNVQVTFRVNYTFGGVAHVTGDTISVSPEDARDLVVASTAYFTPQPWTPPTGGGGGGGGAVGSVNGKAGIVTLTADDLGDGTVKKMMTAAERTKLANVATAATANSADTYLLDRTNHTNVQSIDTILGLRSSLDSKVASVAGRSGSITLTAADLSDSTTTGRGLVTAATAAAARTTLGLSAVAVSGSASDITTGTLPTSVLPALAITDTFTVASQAAMLALTAQRGDVAIRTDNGQTYILATDSPSTLADWKPLSTVGQVASVAGRTGVITLTSADLTDSTATGRSLITAADAASARTTLGLGSAATSASTAFQAADTDLTAIAALTSAADKVPYATGAGTWALTGLSAFVRTLLDDVDAATARTTLGAGTSSLALGIGTTQAVASPPTGVYVWDLFPYTDPTVARPTVASNVRLHWMGPAGTGGAAPTNMAANDTWEIVG